MNLRLVMADTATLDYFEQTSYLRCGEVAVLIAANIHRRST